MGDEDASYFTDADELETGVPRPVYDPDRPPPVNTVDDPDESSMVDPTGGANDERARLADEVRDALAGDGADAQAAAKAFERLVDSGRIDASPDLLPNLARLARRPRTPALLLSGIDPKLILFQAVRHVDDPLRVKQGAFRGTCGAATMEYLLARERPAELVRLADGLTGTDQAVKLRGGATIRLPPSAIERDDSERVDLDRLLQSALMNHATGMSWLFDYDNTKDDDSFWSAIQGNSQVPLDGFRSLYQALTGERHAIASRAHPGAGAVAKDLVARSARRERVAVLIEFGSTTSFHWLALERIDPKAQSVFLRNPWGYDTGEGRPPRRPLPEGGGRIVMHLDTFTEALTGAVVRA